MTRVNGPCLEIWTRVIMYVSSWFRWPGIVFALHNVLRLILILKSYPVSRSRDRRYSGLGWSSCSAAAEILCPGNWKEFSEKKCLIIRAPAAATPCVTLCRIEKCLFVQWRMLCLQKGGIYIKMIIKIVIRAVVILQISKAIVSYTWTIHGPLLQKTMWHYSVNSLLLQSPALYFWKPLSLTRWPSRSRNSLKAGPPSSLLYMSSSVCWPALQYITPTWNT